MPEWVPWQAQAYICHLACAILRTHLCTCSGCTCFHGEKQPFWFVQFFPSSSSPRCGTWHWSTQTFESLPAVVSTPCTSRVVSLLQEGAGTFEYPPRAEGRSYEFLHWQTCFHSHNEAYVSLFLIVLQCREIWAVWVFCFWAVEQLC